MSKDPLLSRKIPNVYRFNNSPNSLSTMVSRPRRSRCFESEAHSIGDAVTVTLQFQRFESKHENTPVRLALFGTSSVSVETRSSITIQNTGFNASSLFWNSIKAHDLTELS